jgi:WD40 repeat protein
MPADRTITVDAEPGEIFFSADGKTLVTSCRDSHIRIFETATGKLLSAKERKGAALMAANRLADRGDGKEIRVWDLTVERQLQMLNGAPGGRMAISGAGGYFAVANGTQRQVLVFDLTSGSQKHALDDGIGGASELLFSPDGETLVAANYDNDIRVWKTQSGELVRKIEDMTGAMFAAEFTPDGKHLVMAGLDETVYFWDARTFRLARTLKGHGETIAALAISPDGKLIVTGGFDVVTTRNPVKVVFWEAASGKVLRTVKSPHRVVSLAFSPDSQWVAMTAGEKEISLWSVPRRN